MNLALAFVVVFLGWFVCALVVVVGIAVVRARARERDAEAKFWAELHDPPPHVRRFPR